MHNWWLVVIVTFVINSTKWSVSELMKSGQTHNFQLPFLISPPHHHHHLCHFPGEPGLAGTMFFFVHLLWKKTSGDKWHRARCHSCHPTNSQINEWFPILDLCMLSEQTKTSTSSLTPSYQVFLKQPSVCSTGGVASHWGPKRSHWRSSQPVSGGLGDYGWLVGAAAVRRSISRTRKMTTDLSVEFNCFGLFYLLLSFLAPAECGRFQ